MSEVELPSLPSGLRWVNPPVSWRVEAGGALTITAGGGTDWFCAPDRSVRTLNAPAAVMTPTDDRFVLSAEVAVDFASPSDAGCLVAYSDEAHWAKLCFESSPTDRPMVVSVVTRGLSDDCNSAEVEGKSVGLRLAATPESIAFHYSLDGRFWHFVRFFALDRPVPLAVGFLAQSPTGRSCTARFDSIHYRAGGLANLRDGA